MEAIAISVFFPKKYFVNMNISWLLRGGVGGFL